MLVVALALVVVVERGWWQRKPIEKIASPVEVQYYGVGQTDKEVGEMVEVLFMKCVYGS